MAEPRFVAGRWIAAGLAVLAMAALIYQVAKDNTPKGEVRRIEGYMPWSRDTLRIAETLPVQNGGRIKPLSTFAGFAMYGLHGARSMKVTDGKGAEVRIKPTAWLLDLLFRPQFAIHEPTFRVDNSAALEAVGVKTRAKRDRYSYSDIEPGRDKLQDLARSYQSIDAKKRDPLQNQIVDLASSMQTYESLLGYFSFARAGVLLKGSGENGGPDKRADISAMMYTAPQIREQLDKIHREGGGMQPHLRDLLEQVLDAANFSKFGLFLIPPTAAADSEWQSAGNVIMDVMSGSTEDPATAIEDIKALENTARAAQDDEDSFRKQLQATHDRFVKRAESRGEYKRIGFEADYYRKDLFLYAMIFFLVASVTALGMWASGWNLAGRLLAWATAGFSLIGLGYCVVAITMRCIIMQRPPVGNLYDTIIFIATAVIFFSLLVEVMVRKRLMLGVGPIVAAALVVLARRFEIGDAHDHMDPLVAVLRSNYWLTIHVITITLGYSAGLLSAVLSAAYIMMRGLRLDNGDQSLRRSLTRAVYGMLCFTLFLSLVGTVLGGIWANYSWGRFWGWDPKENGALLIVLWTLAILHARLGGYLREWTLHFASLLTAVVVTFSWWHVNFLGVGLHNYGFTAGKETIWTFYIAVLVMIGFGVTAMLLEPGPGQAKPAPSGDAPQ